MTANKSFCLSKHFHPSTSEAEYCNWLAARLQNKEIRAFRQYPSIELHVAGKLWRKWAVDFEVTELDGSISLHESKGWSRSDDRFRMKLGHFRLEYPDIPIYVNRERVTGKGWRRESNYKTAKVPFARGRSGSRWTAKQVREYMAKRKRQA